MAELSVEDFTVEKQLEYYLTDKNINCKFKYGYTPTMIAVYRGWYDTIQKIIKMNNNGIEVHWLAINDFKQNVLMIGAKSDYIKQFEMILNVYLNEGISINYGDAAGDTALMIAAAKGNMTIVEMLIKAKADINVKNNVQHTAVQLALLNKYKDVAEILIKNGAEFHGDYKYFNLKKTELDFNTDMKLPPKPEPNEDLKHFTREFTFFSLSNTELHPYRLEKGVEIWSREKQSEFIESCMLNKNFETMNTIIIQIEKKQNEGKYQLNSAEEYIFKMSGHYSSIPINKEENTETDKQKYYVMDGAQRIIAINDFVNNIYVLTNLKRLKNLNGIKFDNLTVEERKIFLNKNLRAVCFTNIDNIKNLEWDDLV